MDCSSSVRGILQTRILEWVAISFWGYLPDPGIKPVSPALADEFFTICSTREAPDVKYRAKNKKNKKLQIIYFTDIVQ